MTPPRHRGLVGLALLLLPLVGGCGAPSPEASAAGLCEGEGSAFAQRVVSFTPGDFAGFGQDRLPGVVLGPPRGGGAIMGSLDVLSLGKRGEIVLEFGELGVRDGPGVDLLVFENPFGSFAETGRVAVSEDGERWFEFACDATNAAEGYPGCAGVQPVYSTPDNGVSATDPTVAGGDGFDLATLGLAAKGVDPARFLARFVRIRDSGANYYGSLSGGFDLDAVAIVHGAVRCPEP
jgi:hypothetical protein